MTNQRMVYLAYPIDNVAGSQGKMIRIYERIDQAKTVLLSVGVDIVFDPGDAFKVRKGSEVGSEIRRVNTVALHHATGVLAVMVKGVTSVGVPIEIDHALTYSKPVALCGDVDTWMFDKVDPLISRFDLTEEGFGQAVAWLVAQRPGFTLSEQPPETVDFAIAHCFCMDQEIVDGLGNVVKKAQDVDDCCPKHGDEKWRPQLPSKTYPDDAGFDLYVYGDSWIPPGSVVDVPCGVAVQLPNGTYGRITGRSSTLRKRNLLVNEGIIDAGWRGELFASVRNMGEDVVQVAHGERLAQLIISPNISEGMIPRYVDELEPHPRGTSGFGSSGA